MEVHLVDGTYELFRHFFGQPPRAADDGSEIGAARGVVLTILGMLSDGATHIGVATDHVIESFRNDLWPGYKTGAGIAPELRAQFEVLEEAVAALGVALWPMVELEADDALASAASVAASDPSGRPGGHLHARQGPGAVRGRQAGRPTRPPQRDDQRRGRRLDQIRGRSRPRSPIGSRWSGTRRTGSRGWPGGVGGRHLWSLPTTAASTMYLTTSTPGIRTYGGRCEVLPSWRNDWRVNVSRPSCSGCWRPSVWIPPCSREWARSSGADRTIGLPTVCAHFRDPSLAERAAAVWAG